MEDNFDFSQEEYLNVLKDLIEQLTAGKTGVEHPVAIVLGGQTGAGKRNIYEIANERFDYNIVEIDCDRFRELHPRLKEINEKCPDEYGDKTNPFVYKLSDDISAYAGEHNMNFITESSMRTPNTHLQICSEFIPKGYAVETHVMATSRVLSMKGIMDRYYDEIAQGKVPRKVSVEFHDMTADNVPNSLDVIYRSKQMSNIMLFNRDKECLYDMSKTPEINPSGMLYNIVNDVERRMIVPTSDYDKMSEQELAQCQKTYGKDWIKVDMWADKKPDEISRITYQTKGNMWRGNVFSESKCVGDFVAFDFESIKKKFPKVSVIMRSMTLLKKENLTPEPIEKKKKRISQTISNAKKSNGTVGYRNSSYAERAMEEKDRFNQLVEEARNKNVLEYFQESGYNIEKKGGQYYVTEITGLVINAEQNQWYNHYENIGRTNNTLDCLTKVLGIDFKQAVYDLTGKDISSVKSEKNYNNNYSKKPVYTTKPTADVVSQPSKIAKELKMPEQSENFRQLFAYMIKTRKIPSQIVDELVKAKLLYQTINEHNGYKNANAVFVHKDENGEIVGAEIQGCNSNIRYKGVATGTKESCFIFTPKPSQDGKFKKAYIFESAIDLMSFYAFCKKDKIQETAFISMAGLKPTVPLKLQEQGVQIFSCVDNDDAGRKFEKENGFTRPTGVIKMLDDNGFKDWNELLVFKTEHPNSTFDKNAYKSEVQEKETEKTIEEIAEAAQNTMADTLDNSIENDEDDMGGPTM